jgi:hypothetical protein
MSLNKSLGYLRETWDLKGLMRDDAINFVIQLGMMRYLGLASQMNWPSMSSGIPGPWRRKPNHGTDGMAPVHASISYARKHVHARKHASTQGIPTQKSQDLRTKQELSLNHLQMMIILVIKVQTTIIVQTSPVREL